VWITAWRKVEIGSSLLFRAKLSKALVKRGISEDVKENLSINNEFASQGRTVYRNLVDTKIISPGGVVEIVG
ncbi:hypothetical protein pipiens_020143, partial [Culex pipiens pipiens]